MQGFFASLSKDEIVLGRVQRARSALEADRQPATKVEPWAMISRRLIAGGFLLLIALSCCVTPVSGRRGGRSRREKPKATVAKATDAPKPTDPNQGNPKQSDPKQSPVNLAAPAPASIAAPAPSSTGPPPAPCDEACRQGRQSLGIERSFAWLLGGLVLLGSIQTATLIAHGLLLRSTRDQVRAQAGSLHMQAGSLNDQVALLKGCVAAAQTTAETAIQQIRHAVASERPWMEVQMAQKELTFNHLKFVAKNRGSSPAKVVMFTVERVLLSTEEAHDGPKYGSTGRVDEVQWRLAGDDFVVGEFQLPPDLSSAVRQPGVSVLYQGFVRYNDTVAEDLHETRFCYEAFSPDDGPVRFRMFAGDGYNAMT